jgi:hypothetical protein
MEESQLMDGQFSGGMTSMEGSRMLVDFTVYATFGHMLDRTLQP